MQLAVIINVRDGILIRYRTPKGYWHSDINEAQLLPLPKAIELLRTLTVPDGLLIYTPEKKWKILAITGTEK